MKKVVLINPPHQGSYRSKIMLGDSLALAAVSGEIIKNGWDAITLDCLVHNWKLEELKCKIIENIPFDAVGITVMSNSSYDILKKIIKIILEILPKAYIFIGGNAPTLNHKEFLNLKLNAIYLGDNLEKIPEILSDCNNYKLNSTKILSNNNKLPPKKIEIINANLKSEYKYNILARKDIKESYLSDSIVSIDTSKGCHGSCSFCTINFQYCSNWIPREIDNIKEELLYIREQLPNAKQIRVVDANFLGGRKKHERRAIKISEIMRSLGFKFRMECRIDDIEAELFSKLRHNGLVGIFTGIENGSQKVLNLLKKGTTPQEILNAIEILQKNTISYSYGYMTISPITNLDIIYENIDFLKKIKYGIRLKHFLNSLIIQKENVFKVQPPIESFEKKVGFKPNFDICSKILSFNQICIESFLGIYELEHAVGIWIERGKESEDNFFWSKDEQL
ncbi:MAG: radical SAM protein [Lactobacillales bacterium]|nr:radical SAM protein [Lactobacillales bacterium]